MTENNDKKDISRTS